jgi:hypothetical protein
MDQAAILLELYRYGITFLLGGKLGSQSVIVGVGDRRSELVSEWFSHPDIYK